jgi:Flp pilus assembly protein TadB
VVWMLLAGLGIMWVAFLVPRGRKRSEARSVIDFEHRMELLANAEVHGTTGRWIVTPRKGVRFLGPDDRRRARARERRRKVFVLLLDAIVLTSLMGLAPPLRAMWYVAASLGVVLILFVWVLLSLKGRSTPRRRRLPAKATGETRRPVGVPPLAAPNVAASPRPAVQGLDIFGDDDPVHVVVRTASAGV